MFRAFVFICISAACLVATDAAFAADPKPKAAQVSSPAKSTTDTVKTAPKVKLKTVFETKDVQNTKNPVVCKQKMRENSRIAHKKICMTKEQWKKQKHNATRAVSSRL